MIKKVILFSTLLFMWGQGLQASTEGEKAEAFMASMGETVITLLTNKSISNKERAAEFQKILESSFNIKAIAKFVLGRYWKQATKDEKETFLKLFKATTVASYATRFKDYTSEKFAITGSRVEEDGGITVLSRIVRPNGQVIPIDWKIFEKDGKFRVYDVILEGISMGITQRSEYAAVIQKGGGKVQAINKALEKKLATYRT